MTVRDDLLGRLGWDVDLGPVGTPPNLAGAAAAPVVAFPPLVWALMWVGGTILSLFGVKWALDVTALSIAQGLILVAIGLAALVALWKWVVA